MMRRSYIGVDVAATGLTAVALQHGRPAARLVGVRREPLTEVLELSSRQPNVKKPQLFVQALTRALDPLGTKEERIALSLPDRVGRLFLVEVDSPFKSHREGVDILKWRLKGSLPLPPQQVQLDYQVMERRDDGRLRCAVATVARPVLEQYEELAVATGRHAVQIDFHSLTLFSYYRPRLDLGDEFLLVTVEPFRVAIIYVAARVLVYHRVRELTLEPAPLFHELTRTLTDLGTTAPAVQRCPVFAHVDPAAGAELRGVLRQVCEREVHYLDPQLKRFSGGAAIGLTADGALLAALGAAERLMAP